MRRLRGSRPPEPLRLLDAHRGPGAPAPARNPFVFRQLGANRSVHRKDRRGAAKGSDPTSEKADVAEFFEWNQAQLGLEIDEMDDQHKKLITMMNELADRNAAGATKEELLEMLRALGRYTVQHFDAEEEYMRRVGYPKLSTHQHIHRDLLRSLHNHIAAFKAGEGKVSEELLSFLKLWLGSHIRGIDRQYATFSQREAC